MLRRVVLSFPPVSLLGEELPIQSFTVLIRNVGIRRVYPMGESLLNITRFTVRQ